VKYITTLLYTLTLVVFLFLLSITLGIALFGTGDLIVPGNILVVLPGADVPWRMCVACVLGTWSMWCVASLAFLFSSLVENSIGPIIGTMTVIIVFLIVSSVPVDLFVAIRPYLFTTYFTVWQKVFEQPVPWMVILSHVGILGLFSVGFYVVTWYIFVRKDILS